MSTGATTATPLSSDDIKRVPQDRAQRDAVRAAAVEAARSLDRTRTPSRPQLEELGQAMLDGLKMPRMYLGFAMVAINNEFWREQFESVPFARRILLLPHCLRDPATCKGDYDSVGLHCAGCGACRIKDLQARAESMGYFVIVAEGTSSVLTHILDGSKDAILGVACLDSLEKSFARTVDLGVPNMALPLLRDGCTETEAEIDLVLATLAAHRQAAPLATRSYVPLLRETTRMFEPGNLDALLEPHLSGLSPSDALAETESIALDWLRFGGKRLRPFVTLAAYAVAKHGTAVLAPDTDLAGLIPAAPRRLSVAIEVMHKASLIHDDIEDGDDYRYGRHTVHRNVGVPAAINVGDHLVGLGYRLVAFESEALGAQCVADILSHLSLAHLELCRGQGAELLWQDRKSHALRPIDAMTIYSLKTAPAFEIALYAGLRAAGPVADAAALHRFCTHVGEGYQVLNDLDDWQANAGNKISLGRDVLARRPTILRAFAIETGGAAALEAMQPAGGKRAEPEHLVSRVREIYEQRGAFEKARVLLGKLRAKALEAARETASPAIRELMEFLVRIILHDSSPNRHGER